MITDGKYFKSTLEALDFEGDAQQRTDTEANAANIVGAIIKAYGASVNGEIDPSAIPSPTPVGLVYGRIQSGKTRAMTASTALAFDNNFRISIVMTSNINDLVTQTHGDFTGAMVGVMTYTKDDDLQREVENVKMNLELGDSRLLIVCSKGPGSLQNVSHFLRDIGAANYPAIIFDDEGDQASLDTNTARRSQSAVAVAPSAINHIIQTDLKTSLSRHVYVSVTGTPQAVLLQSAESTHRPSFIVMLPAGSAYTGGDYFFNTDEPEDNPNKLIEIVDQNEKMALIGSDTSVPEGLKRSILFFLVSASAAIIKVGLSSKGYSHLSHPSLKNNEQEKAESRINEFLNLVTQSLLEDGGTTIEVELKAAYDDLHTTLQGDVASFSDIKETLKQYLATRKLLVINAKVKRQGIAYSKGLNFLIGGNTLGRGIAVKNLLVTYYIRDSRVAQIDTMHQHARMYGYRKKTLAYTRLFIPRHLYYRFRDIHRSDTDSREFIDEHKDMPETFPIQYAFGLRPTRLGVLHPDKTDSLRPRMHIYPNYIVLPQSDIAYQKVLKGLRGYFGFKTESEDQMENKGKQGIEISASEAAVLVKPIKTSSKNTWRDRTIGAAIEKIAGEYAGRVKLRFRRATRTVREGGFISTGTLSGDELDSARDAEIPTLWIMAVETTAESSGGAGLKFMYPTLVIPSSFPHLFMFNRG
jgi:Z1 domain